MPKKGNTCEKIDNTMGKKTGCKNRVFVHTCCVPICSYVLFGLNPFFGICHV
jgi:hypothetical protein